MLKAQRFRTNPPIVNFAEREQETWKVWIALLIDNALPTSDTLCD